VWLVADGNSRQQTVRTGREADDRVEILDGLKAGDTVVGTAAEGHDGPVIAVEKPTAEQLQVKKSEQASQAEL
jgi:multidrug efflux pump subunit AcrA (membrane-fusion protein)